MKIKARVYDIDWDTDGENVDLPDAVEVEVDDNADDEDIINQVSDDYGWCINGVGGIDRSAP